jgi:hypothetical protein
MTRRLNRNGPSPVGLSRRVRYGLAISSTCLNLFLLQCQDFSKTLFTPAGIDIYLRSPITPETRVLVEEIVSKLKDVPGEIARLSDSGFVVGEAK